MTEESTPWGTGLTVAALVAAVIGAAIVVLNLIAVGGLAPTLWGWRHVPVRRWFVLGAAVGVAGGWIALVAIVLH